MVLGTSRRAASLLLTLAMSCAVGAGRDQSAARSSGGSRSSGTEETRDDGVSAPLPGALRVAEVGAPVASAPVTALERTPKGALLRLGPSLLRVTLDERRYEIGVGPVLDWLLRSARAVEAYYGRFPVAEAELFVHVTRGRGVNGGHTQPGSPPRIDINVGESVSLRDLERNWSLTHELVHLALPNLPRPQLWLEEGLASYVEPLARTRAGLIEERAVWREWLENLHLGLPQADDGGLDHTPTWGRIYWGGALFCFLADLELRKSSGGRYELRDALRGILAAGGNIDVRWSIRRTLRAGDAATQGHVLEQLYDTMRDRPVHVDLPQIWRELGVSQQGGEIRYDDQAPLAELRKSFVLGR
jgi:hypothetical protein